jgi:hypothetical protein
MRKKIETELKSLANEILLLSENTDVELLHQKALAVYEKLTLLKFVDNYFETRFEDVDISFSPSKIEEELEDEKVLEVADDLTVDEDLSKKHDEFFEEEEEFLEESDNFLNFPNKQLSLEEELENSISADVASDLFENTVRVEHKSVSLNDKLQNSTLQVGLNDRIAFVKYLFDGSQEEYNRVYSQLNSFETEEEAKDFLLNIVKPDYNWSDKFEYEQRFIFLIERKFL